MFSSDNMDMHAVPNFLLYSLNLLRNVRETPQINPHICSVIVCQTALSLVDSL